VDDPVADLAARVVRLEERIAGESRRANDELIEARATTRELRQMVRDIELRFAARLDEVSAKSDAKVNRVYMVLFGVMTGIIGGFALYALQLTS
jgi:iron only hydrogenase large subunit-like protein